MLDIQPGHIVAVKTTRGVHRGKSAVLALGPWAAKYLPRLGLTLPLKVYLYFMENFNLLGTYKKKKKKKQHVSNLRSLDINVYSIKS